MVRKMILLVLVVGAVAGCSTITYESKDGEKFQYTRLGTQNLSGLKVAKDSQGRMSVSLDKSDGSAGDMAEALKNMSEVAKTVAK